MATAVQLQPHLDDLSVRDLYASECEKIGCRKNSELLKKLPDTPGDFTSLRELDLSLNCVGKKGVRALLWVMRCATNLEKVLLADNFLTNDSIAEIVAVLNEHPAVAHVDVSRNPISHDAGKLLSEFVGTHPIITGVGVRDTLINPALVRIIEKKAAHNNALASGGVPAAAAAATAAEGGGIAAPPAAAVEAKAAAPYADAASVPETVAEAEAPALDSQEQAEAERDLSASWHSISSVQMVSLIDLPTQGRRLHMDGEQFPLINLLADNAQELGALWTDRQRRRAQSAADAPVAEWWALDLVTSLEEEHASALRHVSLAAQPDVAAAANDGFPLLHSLHSAHGAHHDSALSSLVAAAALRGAAEAAAASSDASPQPSPLPAKVELRNLTVLFETAAVTAGDMSGLEYLRHSLEVMHARQVAAAEEGQSRSDSDDGAPATPENLSESGELLRRDDEQCGGDSGDASTAVADAVAAAAAAAAADAEVNASCEEEEEAAEENVPGDTEEAPPSPHAGEWYAMDLIWTIASSKIESAEADADADWSGLASVMSVINNDASPTCPPSS